MGHLDVCTGLSNPNLSSLFTILSVSVIIGATALLLALCWQGPELLAEAGKPAHDRVSGVSGEAGLESASKSSSSGAQGLKVLHECV